MDLKTFASTMKEIVEDIKPIIDYTMKARINRTNLKKGVPYIQVTKNNHKKVGEFVRATCYGSGDGMEVVLIFILDGKEHIVQEEMWGSISGDELSYFVKDE